MDSHTARITAGELAIALSHYDIGEIVSVRRFRGGSRSSPKVLLETRAGEYLLKRRPSGPASEPGKVAFTHEVVLHLGRHGFPVPPLIGTRGRNNSMLQLPAVSGAGGPAQGATVYEMYRYIRGRRYDRSIDDARAAGWWLARCHELLAQLQPRFPAPARSFHAHPKVAERLTDIPGVVGDPGLRATCRALADHYARAAAEAERLFPNPPAQIVHGDWHPGNMLFRAEPLAPKPDSDVPPIVDRIAAVFDFDAARMGCTLHDLANGAMQFAISRHIGGAEAEHAEGAAASSSSPGEWKIALEPSLFEAFFAGYHGGRSHKDLDSRGVGPAAVRAVPWLMIEALIVEAAVPIAQTGKFGKLAAGPLLGVVLRAVEAMAGGQGAERLAALAARPYH